VSAASARAYCWDTCKQRREKGVKTEHPREVPVHPVLAHVTFISLALADGVDRDTLAWVTHGPKGDIVSLYTTLPWESLYEEVAKLKVELRPPSMPPIGSALPSDEAR